MSIFLKKVVWVRYIQTTRPASTLYQSTPQLKQRICVDRTALLSINDLGVTVISTFGAFFNHHQIVNRVKRIMFKLLRGIGNLTPEMFQHSYQALVRPILEYNQHASLLYLTTSLVKGTKELSHKERLHRLNIIRSRATPSSR